MATILTMLTSQWSIHVELYIVTSMLVIVTYLFLDLHR
jgi:hypothetical protein